MPKQGAKLKPEDRLVTQGDLTIASKALQADASAKASAVAKVTEKALVQSSQALEDRCNMLDRDVRMLFDRVVDLEVGVWGKLKRAVGLGL